MTNTAYMKIHLHLWLICLSIAPAVADAADSFLIENGESRPEIIIAESPARSTRLAAAELQTNVAKISGAQLPIRTKPSADVPVQIYIGESPHAAKLGLTADGLEHGAYRIVSGENWLALIGDDSDFEPVHPFARTRGDLPRSPPMPLLLHSPTVLVSRKANAYPFILPYQSSIWRGLELDPIHPSGPTRPDFRP